MEKTKYKGVLEQKLQWQLSLLFILSKGMKHFRNLTTPLFPTCPPPLLSVRPAPPREGFAKQTRWSICWATSLLFWQSLCQCFFKWKEKCLETKTQCFCFSVIVFCTFVQLWFCLGVPPACHKSCIWTLVPETLDLIAAGVGLVIPEVFGTQRSWWPLAVVDIKRANRDETHQV